jgi:hypothetical protein
MRLDFYIHELNTAIEFDGIQHFQIYRRYTPDEETLKLRQQFDVDKTMYCIENKIKLIRIHYESLNNINQILDKVLSIKSNLIFTNKSYEYIIDKIKEKTSYDVI